MSNSRTALVVAGAMAMAVLAGCASPAAPRISAKADRPATTRATATRTPAPPSNYSYPASMTAERVIAARADMLPSPEALADRIGLRVPLPPKLGPAAFKRAYTNKKGMLPDLGKVEYEGYRFIYVWPMGSSAEASSWLVDWERNPDFRPYVKTLNVGPFEARALDKLDIPPVDNPDGTKVVGTGIYTSGARVIWTVGRFGIEVADADTPLAELLPAVLEWGSK